MSKPPRLLGVVLLSAGTVASLAACSKDQLPGPKPEVQAAADKVSVPDVPDEDTFAFPKHGGSVRSVKELRVKADNFLDQRLTVRGFVVETYTWAKDCAPTITKQEGWTEVEVLKAIADDPTQCNLIKFFIGDAKDTPVAQSLWVVDAPRAPTPLEIKNGIKEELADPWLWKEIVPYDIGDEVEVTGTFSRSHKGERNVRGLLAYESIKNITKGVESKPLPARTERPAAPPPGVR